MAVYVVFVSCSIHSKVYESMSQLVEDFPIKKATLGRHMKKGFYQKGDMIIKRCEVVKRKQGGVGRPFKN